MEPEIMRLDESVCVAEASHFVLEYQEALCLSRITWKRKPSSLEYRHAITYWLEHLKKNKVERTLFNNSHAGLISDEDVAWSEYYIKNLLPKTNLRKSASVVSNNILQRMLIRNMYAERKPIYFQMEFFSEEQQAYHWLTSPS
ncbi:hypothetical protein [Pontibacter oryzae]|uniref:STAS/SEC14 domain-containing protein n=1 Tax=Pontibacter oryzae TaxID=2304593 RepID=A0A399S385_9BACT|nr:hypothetical protein [Pontibacter oryzae]RIJ36993.1 hypothetical protein D1627_14350 [Pontibacter oryzae]